MEYSETEIEEHIRILKAKIRATKKLGYTENTFEIRYLKKSLNSWIQQRPKNLKGNLEYQEEIRRNTEHLCQFCGEALPKNEKEAICWRCRIAEE